MTCQHCGSQSPRDLAVEPETRRILFGGEPLGLTNSEAEIMAKLIKLRRAPYYRLHPTAGTLRVIIHRLRKALPEEVAVLSIRGWGYELRCPL